MKTTLNVSFLVTGRCTQTIEFNDDIGLTKEQIIEEMDKGNIATSLDSDNTDVLLFSDDKDPEVVGKVKSSFINNSDLEDFVDEDEEITGEIDDEDEERRRDEKNGLYPQHEDDAN